MDLFVMNRKATRASYTRAYNGFIHELSELEPYEENVRTRFTILERLASELHNLENEWHDIFSQQERKLDDFEQEYAQTEEYKEKMDVARVKVEAFLNKLAVQNNITSTCSSPTPCRRKLKLPKIEMKTFGGDVKDWLSFWSQFSRIHEDKEMEDEDKFQYLIQATASGTRAREIVDSLPPTVENYAKAIDSLKSRFGREELLMEVYVRELLGLIIKNATETKNNVNTAQLYDKLESYLRALESIGMTTDKYATMLFPMVESCIPEELLRVWLRIPAMATVVEPQNNAYSDKLNYCSFVEMR
jgi:hypothetical protein